MKNTTLIPPPPSLPWFPPPPPPLPHHDQFHNTISGKYSFEYWLFNRHAIIHSIQLLVDLMVTSLVISSIIQIWRVSETQLCFTIDCFGRRATRPVLPWGPWRSMPEPAVQAGDQVDLLLQCDPTRPALRLGPGLWPMSEDGRHGLRSALPVRQRRGT